MRTALGALVAATIVVAAASVVGCGDDSDQSRASGETVAVPVDPPPLPTSTPTPDATATATVSPTARRPERRGGILAARDASSFREFESSLGGASGLAVSAVGRGRRVYEAGSLRSAVAWSTSKVPIAMAVIASGAGQAHAQDISQAITASDNAAAERLWAALGGGTVAAKAADAQLRLAGDRTTRIESRELAGPQFTPFGQTTWSLPDQARFTAGVPCTDAGSQVLRLMSTVAPGQRWGLGTTGSDAAFKGGWGPGAEPGGTGGYVDRQMGVVYVSGKPLVVTIATRPGDGSHETGTRNLTAITNWVTEHVSARDLPSRARC